MSKVELSVYVEEEEFDVAESLKENSLRTPEIKDMSRSEAAREIYRRGLESIGENPDLEDLVDDVDLEVWRKQKEYDREKKKGRILEMQGGWRGRVRSRLNGRLAGAEPYRPEKIIALCDHYWREIEIWEEDEDLLEDHRRWLDQQIDEYQRAYQAKEVYPDESFDDVDDQVAVGSDLLRLKPQIVDVVETIERKASMKEWTNADAIRDAIANEFAVDPESIDVVLDYVVPEDVTVKRALRNGEEIREILPDEALEGSGPDLDDLESRQVHEDRPDSFHSAVDDHAERARLRFDQEDVEEIDAVEIDGDVLEQRIGGESDD